MLRSADGGTTWTLVYRAAGVGFFGELQMISSNAGFAAGVGILYTTDGGVTWHREQNNIPNPPGTYHNVGPDGYVYGLAVVDQGHVWTAGYDGYIAGVIYHRVPERPQPDPNNPNYNTPWWLEWAVTYRGMYGISAVSQTTAWAVGYAGYVWKTTDGGSWFQQESHTGVPLNDVAAVNSDTAWAVGDSGTILNTTDGGTTWAAQASGTLENLKKISAVSSNLAWVVGAGGTILKTTNGGTTWMRQFSGTSAPLFGVAAVDSNVAWIVGEGNMVLHTTDGGGGTWPAPTITTVTPNLVGQQSSPLMTVTITGTGFRGGNVGVLFGDTPAEGVTWVNTTTLQAIAPYGIGTFSLRVTNEDGQSATLPNAITFVPYPVMTNYSPWHGPASGGYQITVDGFNLQTVSSAELYSYVDSQYYPLQVTVVDSTQGPRDGARVGDAPGG